MEPTEQELAGLATVGPLLDWIGLTDGEELATEFYAAFGADRDTQTRVIARMPKVDFETVTATITVNTAAPGQPAAPGPLKPVQASLVAMIWETARLAVGAEKLTIVKERERLAKEAADRAVIAQAPQQQPQPPQQQASKKTVSAELTVDQTDRKTDYAKMSAIDVAAAYEEYHLRMGGKAGAIKRVLPMPEKGANYRPAQRVGRH